MTARRGGPAAPTYLVPYVKAWRRHRRGLQSLLWEDREAQTVRFGAIVRNCPLDGVHVLDVGCGRGDLLTYLWAHRVFPSRYTGIDARGDAVLLGGRNARAGNRILKADFVKTPEVLTMGADVVVFSGSLNLLTSRQFYRILSLSWEATSRWLVFNFLDSPSLAGTRWLKWHRRDLVLAFATRSASLVVADHGYEPGDCTIAMRK